MLNETRPVELQVEKERLVTESLILIRTESGGRRIKLTSWIQRQVYGSLYYGIY